MTPTIQTEIELLQDTKSELEIAIMEKGVLVEATDTFAMYPTRISQISMTPGTYDNLYKSLIDRSITSITIPSSVKKIRDYCFERCDYLTDVTIPEGITEIGRNAFAYCTSLTTIEIPITLIDIGSVTFESCTNLTSITCYAIYPPTMGAGAFDNTNDCPIYVPADSVEVYKTEWSRYASRIQAIPTYKGSMTYNSGSDTLTMPGDYICGYDSDPYPETLRDCDITEPINTAGIYASDIETLTINDSITTIYLHLHGFSNLQSITCLSPYPPTLIDYPYAFEDLETNSCPIYVPSASLNDYLDDPNWHYYAPRIQAIIVPSKMIITNDNGGTIETISVPEDHICDGEEISYPTTIKYCDYYELYASQHYTEDIRTITICENITQIDLGLMGCTGLESITIEATTPPEIYDDVFVSAETNDCPIYVPTDSLQDYLDDPNWGMFYSSRLQAIPEPVVPKFVRIAETTDATDGKYLIVDMDSNKALNASLITSTTSTSNGLNNFISGNTISVTIEQDGTITANAENLNAAAYYDATNQRLYWEDGNNVKYYLSQNRTTSSNFKYTSPTTVPTTTITPYKGNANYITLKETKYLGGDGNNTISWYSGETQIGRIALFKYVEE